MYSLRSVARSLAYRSAVVTRGGARSFTYSHVYLNKLANTNNGTPDLINKASEMPVLDDKSETVKEPTNVDAESKAATFEGLAKSGYFDKDILRGIKLANFKTLTPVQEKSLVPILEEEKGIVCRAKTGTGKTLAFVIPTLQCAIENFEVSRKTGGKVHALVIAPTRDLALQIEAEYKKIIQSMPNGTKRKARIEVHMGGRKTRSNPDFAPAIVIATPGRLNDNLSKPKFASMFTDLQYRVYDEADRLLDEGFSVTLDDIDRQLKQVRKSSTKPDTPFKSVLFSATVDRTVADFAKSVIGDEYKFIDCVDKNEPEAHENIEQTLIKTNDISESFNGALSFVVNNMNKNNFKAMVFLPTITTADWFYSMLMNAKNKDLFDTKLTRTYNSKILRLHGKMSQAARDRTVKDFRRLTHGVLVCTDVAARGLDFSDVSDVVQMGPSSEVADYIHKIGRTARAGASGKSTLFLSEIEKNYKKALQNKRGVKFEHEIEYETAEEDKKLVQEIGAYAEDVESFIPTFMGYYKLIGGVYNVPQRDSLAQIMEYYRFLLNDPTAKLSVSNGFIRNVISVPPREASLYFDIPGGFNFSKPNHRATKRTFMDDSRGNPRGGFSNRGKFNRNDDRRSNSYNDRGSGDGGYKKTYNRDSNRSNDRQNTKWRGEGSRNSSDW